MNNRYPSRENKDAVDQLRTGWSRVPEVLQAMGYKELRQGQQPVVCNILAGKDTLCVLPTGTGKTACFVVPTLALNWKTIVFSPLVALMRDQVQSLNRLRIPAMALSSMQSDTENAYAAEQWALGKLSFLYVAPERLHNQKFKDAMDQTPPDMVVLDEAHTLSQWSENFRSSYCKVGDFIADKKPQVVAAFTATCPAEVEADVRRVLGIPNANKVVFFPRRTNLHLESREVENMVQIADALRHEITGPAIVYCSTVNRTEETAATLSSLMGEEVVHFHGQLTDSEKRTNMDLFMSDRVRIVCATNAFGMGVDKPNVRGVIHRDIPGCIEALSQEIGRAGRDGNDSLCLTFYSDESLKTQKFFIECGNPSPQEIRQVFSTLKKAADRAGNVEMTIGEIGQRSGVFKWKVTTIMEILKANSVIERVDNKQKLFRVRRAIQGATSDSRFNLWWDIIDNIGVKSADGFLEVDMASFVQQTGLSEPTVRNWLKKWQDAEVIRYVPPFSGAPTKILGSLNLIDFSRLEGKLELSYEKLNKVLEYIDTPDADKHEFLENYFAHTPE